MTSLRLRRAIAPRVLLLACAAALPVSAWTETQQPPAAPAQPPAWQEVPLEPGIFRDQTGTYRADTVDVPVKPGGGSIEYMVRMRVGAAIVYAWRALEISDAAKLTSEFHGHTDRAPGTTGTLVFYRKATGATESGSLVAPFDGIHGWYFKNDTDRPVTIRITIAGFYEIIPQT
jgi:hypothetical protein